MRKKIKHPLGITRLIALGFLTVIAIGTSLLMLPISSRAREVTPLIDALFTATSATCVTGLTVYDTYAHWSTFGQAVILCLIQIGGLGFVTVISIFAMMLHKKVSLRERLLIQQSAGSLSVAGVTGLVKKAVIITALFEGTGALLLALRFCPEFGFGKGLWMSLFHSVSAFCNAGFDILGIEQEGTSLITVNTDPLIMLTLSTLIICGGLGFLVWSDLIHCRGVFRKLRLHSKLVLLTSGILLIFGTVFFLAADFDGAFAEFGFLGKLLQAFFCSVTARTAGYFSVDMSTLSVASLLIMTVLMFIGGSPGSTAGGIKTTTLSVLSATLVSSVRRKASVTAFDRRISDSSVRLAISVFFIYLFGVISGTAALSLIDGLDLLPALFEISSALGTVGLSLGVSSGLSTASKLIVAFCMFAGRVGGLSLALAITEKHDTGAVEKPTENILIG